MAASDRNRGDGDEPIETQFGDTPFDDAEGFAQRDDALELEESSEQLALEEDERLPWLDADDDDSAHEPDGGRILGLAILGLIALATIVGGIWWSTHRNPDPTLVADGSTIAAPSEAYKEAPKDPGGKTFDGTGNTAFAVSEGQDRPARLGEAPPPAAAAGAARPGFDLGKGPAGGPPPAPGKAPSAIASTPASAAAAAPADGPAVQVGAYSTRASAEAGWSRLTQQYSALSGQRYRIVEGKADIGTVFRLQAVPGDAAAAQALCGRLKSAGLACQVK